MLAGHSYGGAVISNVPADAGDIVGLVYVAAFALAAGETALEASSLVPGATLGETIETVLLPGGGVDQYIALHRFGDAVLRGRARGPGHPDGGHPTTGHRGRVVRAVRP